jgi:ketosteroid isomerase-like protein
MGDRPYRNARAACGISRVSDGTRTRDRRDHNPELYQLSYAHQDAPNLACRTRVAAVSEGNVEIARAALEAFNDGDVDRLVRLAAADIEIESSQDLANAGTFVGRDGYLAWVGQWMEAWGEFTVEPLDMEPVGERHVIARVLQRGKGRGSGIETSLETTYLYELRDGKIARFSIYLERADALAAAGAV